MNVKLYVERLVLEGIDLPPAQRPQLQAALAAELGRLLAAGGMVADLAAGGVVPSVRASGFELSAGASPGRLAQLIAKSVYGGIGT